MGAVVTCALWVTMSGCLERESAPIGPNLNFGQEIIVRDDGVSRVDVLFVIDDSGSMSHESGYCERLDQAWGPLPEVPEPAGPVGG